MPVKTIADLEQEYLTIQYKLNNRLPENGQFDQMFIRYSRMYDSIMPVFKEYPVLDLACGPGQFVQYCLRKKYKHVTGVDHCKEMVDYGNRYMNGHFIQSDALEFLKTARHNYYGLIVMNDFIEHVPLETGLALVGLAHDCLKPNGRIILKTGNMAAFGGLTILCNDLTHYTGYTEKSLSSVLRLYGFEKIEMRPYYENKKHKFYMDIHHLLYKHVYKGNYPKVLTKIIIATGVKDK